MAVPTALTCLVPPNTVGNESPVGGRDIGSGEFAAMVLMYGQTPGGVVKPFLMTDDGLTFIPPATEELWANATSLGDAILAGATKTLANNVDLFTRQWVVGALRFTQAWEFWIEWSAMDPYDDDYSVKDDVTVLAAGDRFKPDTPRRARYASVFVKNTSGSTGYLFGSVLAENSGAI